MQRAFDAGSIVESKCTYAMRDVVDVLTRDREFAESESPCWKASFRRSAQIHHDLDQILQIGLPVQGISNVRGHHAEEKFQVVCDFLAGQFSTPRLRRIC